MNQQTNPFLQHAVRHGQSLLTEAGRAVSLSQEITANCDNITMAINSGNPQNALNSIQNIKNMSNQIAQSTQFINQALNERLDMTAYFLDKIQNRVNDMSMAVQSLRGNSSNNHYHSTLNHYGTSMSQQANSPIM